MARPHDYSTHAMAVVIGLATLATAPVVEAQTRERVGVEQQDLDFADRRLDGFSPRSGPPGTVVTLQATDMPPLAPLRMGVGALRFGFEEAGWVLVNDDGTFTTEIEIPSWARFDVVHLFIVFDPYFVPVALSNVFHVTDRNGNVRRQGRIMKDNNPCPFLRGTDGIPYALVGDLADFQPGDEVIVEGPVDNVERCDGFTTIQITRIRHSNSP